MEYIARKLQSEQANIWTILDSPAEKVSQGDLFFFSEENKQRRYGIVVTADCDLRHNKHSKLVSFVPLLELDDILSNFIYIDYLEKFREEIASMLEKEIKTEVPHHDRTFLPIISSILNENSKYETVLIEAAKVYLNESDYISTDIFNAILKILCRSSKKAFTSIEQQVNSRGDILVLTKPPFVESDVSIVWLRSIWQVNIGLLSLRTSSYSSGKNIGQHVARLSSPYKYRLTQQFAQVFSDIGTPDICKNWIKSNLAEKINDK